MRAADPHHAPSAYRSVHAIGVELGVATLVPGRRVC